MASYSEFGLRPLVLVVEDDARLLQAKRELFEDFGVRTIGASNYDKALSEVSSLSVDLVVIDIDLNLANKNGFELARAIRGIAPRLPLVGYSTLVSRPDASVGQFDVFDGYLRKETDSPHELIAHLSTWFDLASNYAKQKGGGAKVTLLSSEIKEYAIGARRAQLLIDEFKAEGAFLVLAPTIKDLGLSEITLADIMSTMRQLMYATHEKRPVCTALLVTKSLDMAVRLGEFYAHAPNDATISDTNLMRSFASLVDGFDGTIVVLSTGHVAGAITYPMSRGDQSALLPARYGPPLLASSVCQGLLILFSGDGRVECFVKGAHVMSHRNGVWRLNPNDLQDQMRPLASQHRVQLPVLERSLQIALTLADQGHGAMLCVGDHDAVQRLADPQNQHDFAWQPRNILEPDSRAIKALARQDGATVITNDGTVVRGAAFLRPTPDTKAVKEKGTGSRHGTAAKVSSATNAIVVTVSSDGKVSFYSKGDVKLRLFG